MLLYYTALRRTKRLAILCQGGWNNPKMLKTEINSNSLLQNFEQIQKLLTLTFKNIQLNYSEKQNFYD